MGFIEPHLTSHNEKFTVKGMTYLHNLTAWYLGLLLMGDRMEVVQPTVQQKHELEIFYLSISKESPRIIKSYMHVHVYQ